MYELVNARLHAVGPTESRFDLSLDLLSTLKSDNPSNGPDPTTRSTPKPVFLVGANGIGKTILGRLIRLVVAPGSLYQSGVPIRTWRRLVSSDEIGQVILEWRDPHRKKSLFTGLAMGHQVNGSGAQFSYYSVQSEGKLDISSLTPSRKFNSMRQLRDHISKVIDLQPGAELTWASHSKAWMSHIGKFGLGPTSVLLLTDDYRTSRQVEGADGFLTQLVQELIPSDEIAALNAFDVGVGNAEAYEALLSALIDLVQQVVDGIPAVERLTAISSAEHDDAEIKLVKFNVPAVMTDDLKEYVKADLNEYWPARYGDDYAPLQRIIKSVMRNEFRVDILDPSKNGRYFDLDNLMHMSPRNQEFPLIVLRLLLARAQAVLSSEQADNSIVVFDAPLRFAESTLNHIELMIRWQLQVIYLSTFETGAHERGMVFELQKTLSPETSDPITIIGPTATLVDLLPQIDLASITPDGTMDMVRLDQIFDVIPNPADVQLGDFLVPTVRRVGHALPVGIVTDSRSGLPHSLSQMTALRPKGKLLAGENLFYASYLGSDVFLGEHVEHDQLVIIQAQALAQIGVPRPDPETLRAISELTKAARTFDTWHRDADDAVRSFFEWRDLATARAKMIETGRLTRQRGEAAHVLDSSGRRFRATLPYPIARRWRDVEAAPPDEVGYKRVLDCAEVAVTYCAVLGLVFASSKSIIVPRLNQIARKLGHSQSPTFGDWSAVLDNLVDIALSTGEPIDSPLRQYAHFRNEVADAIRNLKRRRNDISHGRGPGIHETSAQISSATRELSVLLHALEWLVDYPIRYLEAEQWDSFENSTRLTYRELMGDHNVVIQGRDETPGHLEARSSYVVDQFGHYYLLRPFLHTDYCSACGQLSVFVIDGWNPLEQRTAYKAMDHSHVINQMNAYASLQAVGLLDH